MGGANPFRSLRYPITVAIRLKTEDAEKLNNLAREKGYAGKDIDHLGKKLKQPKSGAARLAREIIEKYLTDLDNIKK